MLVPAVVRPRLTGVVGTISPVARQSIRERLFAAVYDPMQAKAERGWLGRARPQLLQHAEGEVLEIGAGTGANLRHYGQVDRLVLTEPSEAMRMRLHLRAEEFPFPVEVLDASADALPFPDGHFDTVVITLALCSVPDQARALAEVRRVLRPDGKLLVLEHVRSGDPVLARRQDRIQPVWTWLGVGCRPNLDTAAAVEAAGFTWVELSEFEIPLPVVKPHIMGVARRGRP